MNIINLIRILLPLLIITGTIVCIRSGVEFANLPDLAKEPDLILIFYSISLFTFGAKDFGAPVAGPLALQSLMWFFYFFAPMVTLVAMADILSLIRPIYLRYIKIFRPYFLIMGYGRIGKSALEAIQEKVGKGTHVIILDKKTDETENDFSIIFENIIQLRKEVDNPDVWKKFITKRCCGVFVLTDNELLNLRIYNELSDFIISNGFNDIEGFTRIRSLEIIQRLDLRKDNLKNLSDKGWTKHHFINVHVSAPELLFAEKDKFLNCFLKNDKVNIHYQRQLDRFYNWQQIRFDTFVFVGFGSFSAYMFQSLYKKGIINENSEIIIADPFSRKNWGGFVLDSEEFSKFEPLFYQSDFELMYDQISFRQDASLLCIFATNDQERNIHSASYFNRKYRQVQTKSIIRTKNHDLMDDMLLDSLIGENQWIIIPTYTWIKLSFEQWMDK
jgi:hypothetical protein